MEKVLTYIINGRTFKRVIRSQILCPFNIDMPDSDTTACTHLSMNICSLTTCPLDDAKDTDNEIIFGVEVKS